MEKYTPAENRRNGDDRDVRSRRLREDPLIAESFRRLHIPADETEKHPALLERWLKAKHRCDGCPGLEKCRQNLKGMVEELSYDGVLGTELTPCLWLKEKQNAEAHLDNYLVNDLPAVMRTVSFRDIGMDGESTRYLKALQTAMSACLQEKSLYIYGNMGTGKTMLAACCANEMAGKGRKTAFVSMPKFAERIALSLRTGEYQQEVQRLCYADFVVFDDIGAENVTERYRSILLSVLDARMQEGRMTWFTSNEDFRSLQNHYILNVNQADAGDAERILERIRATADTLEVIGKDRRKLSDTGR